MAAGSCMGLVRTLGQQLAHFSYQTPTRFLMGPVLKFTRVPPVLASSCFLGYHLPWYNVTCRLAESVLTVNTRVGGDGPGIGQISSLSFTAWGQMLGGLAPGGLTQHSPHPPFPKGGGNISPSPDVRDLP